MPNLVRGNEVSLSDVTIQFGLDCNGIILRSTIRVTNNNPLTIDGNGHQVAITVANPANGQPRTERPFWALPGSNLSLRDLVLQSSSNVSQEGGGAILNQNGTVTVDGDQFISNGAKQGGAIANRGGTLNVSRSTFNSDSASHGGAIFNASGTVAISRSTFTGNVATIGGAIRTTAGGAVSITDSTISQNAAASLGGGISNGGSLTLTDVTVTQNRAQTLGSGIYNACGSTLTMDGTTTVTGNVPATNQLYYECP